MNDINLSSLELYTNRELSLLEFNPRVNEQAIYFMKDIGYDLAAHTPKSLNDIPQITYDYVVTMGCSDECPSMSVNYRGDWNIPDPKNMEMDSFNKVRDTIKGNVVRLIEETKVNNTAFYET